MTRQTQKSQSSVLCVPFQAQQNALTATAVGKCTTLFLCQDWHRNFLRMEFDIAGCYISFAYAEWYVDLESINNAKVCHFGDATLAQDCLFFILKFHKIFNFGKVSSIFFFYF